MSRSSEETIFASALSKPAGIERAAFLDDACHDDAHLRARVEELLAAHTAAGGFLESPPPDISGVAVDLDKTDLEHGAMVIEQAGSIIGPYRLLEQIGEGGMGVVFRAEQTRPVRREVALKIIKPGMDTCEVIGRFEAERQALAIMDHPGVAKVLDAGTTAGGRPYFVMDLVRGVPVTQYCDQHQLTPRQRLELFVQVCQAVQHAHQKGIIHRDLKPSNVLVTLIDGRAVPKVIDFGIAKATGGQRLSDWTQLTQVRQLVGTPLYMSPEQAEPSLAAEIDTRSDVYSLGVLLYELLTGTTPFDGKRLARAALEEVRRIIREEEPPRPSTRLSTLETLPNVAAHRSTEPRRLSATIRGELDWIVMKALEKEQSRRYETANGLARDVERYLAQEPVEAHPPSTIYLLRKFARRHQAAIAVGAALLIVLSLGALISTWQAIRATKAERQIRAERDVAVAEKDRADRAAHTAHNVSHYLQGLIANINFSGPPQPPGETIRQILDQFAGQFEKELADDPAAKSSLHNIVGEAYHNLGEFDKAEFHLSRAVELRRTAMGDQDLNYAGLLIRYAGLLRHKSLNGTNRWAEAESCTRESIDICRRAGSNQGVLNGLWMLGLIQSATGRTAEARETRAQRIALGRITPGFNELESELAAQATAQGQWSIAEKHLRDYIAIDQAHGGGNLPWAYWELANALSKQGKFREALDVQIESLAIFRRTRPPDHAGSIGATLERMSRTVRAARDASALATLFPDVSDVERTELQYRGSANVEPAAVKNDPATTANQGLMLLAEVCYRLAEEHASAGRAAIAEAFRAKGNALLSDLAQRLPDDPQLLAARYEQLIDLQFALSMDAQAKDLARQFLHSPATKADAYNKIAWHLANCPNPHHQDPELSVALASKAVQLAPQDATARCALGAALCRAGRYEPAIAELTRSIELSGRDGNAWHCFFLALANHHLGNAGPAREWYVRGAGAIDSGKPNEQLRTLRSEVERALSPNSPATAPTITPSTRPASATAASAATAGPQG